MRDVEGLGFRVQSLWLASGAAAHESSVWQRILLPLTPLGFAEFRLKDRVPGPCPERSLNPPPSLSLSLSPSLSLSIHVHIYIYIQHIYDETQLLLVCTVPAFWTKELKGSFSFPRVLETACRNQSKTLPLEKPLEILRAPVA